MCSGAYVSAGAFELLGDRPVLGRTFRPEEDDPGSPAVVILGGELWSSRYGSDPGIVGQTITVNGVPSTVIGVMPRGFMFPANADLWRPMANLPAAVRQSRAERRLAVFARLADGATEEQARVDMATLGEGWAREFSATNRDVRMRVVPINEQLNPSVAQRAWIAFITAGVLVLLVACANVANLLLMRAATRGREMAIRTSIGATRGRVVRQLLVESATLSALAGAIRRLRGLGRPAHAVRPSCRRRRCRTGWRSPWTGECSPCSIGVCVVSVFVCGLPSALHVSKVDLRDTLTESGTTTVARPARRWIAALLAAEFAVTLVLIAVAVTGVRSNLENASHGVPDRSRVAADDVGDAAAGCLHARRVRGRRSSSDSTRPSARPVGSIAYASVLPYGGGSQQPLTMSGRVARR